ncbi:MAG: hypothetical protein ACRETO_07085, partial [Gammaproteobacteria bacterium]
AVASPSTKVRMIFTLAPVVPSGVLVKYNTKTLKAAMQAFAAGEQFYTGIYRIDICRGLNCSILR